MFATRTPLRASDVVIRAAIVALALATGYIHLTLGGLLFTLNALGYFVAAVAMVVPLALAVRFRWFIRLGLMGYAATTILGWAIQGPYFQIAYIAKGIEVALIALSPSTSPAWTATPSRSSSASWPRLTALVARSRGAAGAGAYDPSYRSPYRRPRHRRRAASIDAARRMLEGVHRMKRLVLGLALAAFALLTVACSSGGRRPLPRPARRPAPAPPRRPVTESSSSPRTSHSRRPHVTIPADTATDIVLDNQEDVPHNIAIKDGSGADRVQGRDRRPRAKVTNAVPALAAGAYAFWCEVHPNMTGHADRRASDRALPETPSLPDDPGPSQGTGVVCFCTLGRRCSRSSIWRNDTDRWSRSTARASRRGPGRVVGFLGPERRRQDHDDALHLRAGPTRPRRGALEGRAGRPRGAPAVRLHARAARPVSADAGRRADELLRPAARAVVRARRTPPRRAGSSGWASATAPSRSSRSCRTATSNASSWPSRSPTTRSCSSSTSRSPGSTRSASRR